MERGDLERPEVSAGGERERPRESLLLAVHGMKKIEKKSYNKTVNNVSV